ncbi:hypothetical protein [Salinigranum sp.]|uniref:hypothetical protein n=1 Tax=Salinigranum sp. TaxID=1966351 RepID=UPI0035617C2E
MQPSRRALLRASGTAGVAVIAGCSTGLGGGVEQTSTPVSTRSTQTESDADFEMRLSGPETERTLFDADGVASVGAVRDAYDVPLTLTDDETAAVSETFRATGVSDDPDAFEVVAVHDGEQVSRFGVAPGLAEAIAAGEWDGRLRVTFAERETAEDVRETLAA